MQLQSAFGNVALFVFSLDTLAKAQTEMQAKLARDCGRAHAS
jgi:hypothetical protein